FIGFNATKNLLRTFKVMLQSVPDNVNVTEMLKDLRAEKGIKDIHDVHVWSLDGTYNIGSLHAVVDTSVDPLEHGKIMQLIIRHMQKYHIDHPTVQIERGWEFCSLESC